MKNVLAVLAVCLSMVASALAQSSGNFTAVGTSAACVAQAATFVPANCSSNSACPSGFSCSSGGVCTGDSCTTDEDCGLSGSVCSGGVCVVGGSFTGTTLIGGTTLSSFRTSIQTPGGQGTTLLIRPSLDTGLFTSTRVTATVNSASSAVGTQVCVFVDPTIDGDAVSGGLPVQPANCIVYDQRIQQVSNTLFNQLSNCSPTGCSTDQDCADAGQGTCVIAADAESGTCSLPNPTCSFSTLLTTLSAHSFDFVVPMPGTGDHEVVVVWGKIGTSNPSAASCVGPAVVTVQQVRNFRSSEPITFTNQ